MLLLISFDRLCELISAFPRCQKRLISALILGNLRIRANRALDSLACGRAAHTWKTSSLEHLRRVSLFDPSHQVIDCEDWDSAVASEAVSHAWNFKVAVEVIDVGNNLLDTLIVIETAV